MENTFLYFFGVLAFNITASVVSFGVAYFSHRNRRAISWLRGIAVLLIGWVLGSAIVFLVHLLLAPFGIRVESTDILETAIAFIVLLPVMFFLYQLFSRALTAPAHDEPSAT